MMCGGSEEDKVNAVFEVFDADGDGFISIEEMRSFLTSVFQAMLTPKVLAMFADMGVAVESAEELAHVTAAECFEAADVNMDVRLSVSEFKGWFFASKNDPAFMFSPLRQVY